jgi:hypothetical protein
MALIQWYKQQCDSGDAADRKDGAPLSQGDGMAVADRSEGFHREALPPHLMSFYKCTCASSFSIPYYSFVPLGPDAKKHLDNQQLKTVSIQRISSMNHPNIPKDDASRCQFPHFSYPNTFIHNSIYISSILIEILKLDLSQRLSLDFRIIYCRVLLLIHFSHHCPVHQSRLSNLNSPGGHTHYHP